MLTATGRTGPEWRRKLPRPSFTTRCRGPLRLLPWSPRPLLLLLGTVLTAQGTPVVVPVPPPDTVGTSLQHTHSGHRARPLWPGGEEAGHPCDHHDRGAEPQLLYTEELFARMQSADGATSGASADPQTWERITMSCCLDKPRRSHTLLFDISWLAAGSNITMAKVLVVTNATSGKNGCQPQLKKSRRHEKLACQKQPLGISRLAAVDVTSLLREQLGRRQLHVYVKRMRHVIAAELVVFEDLAAQELLEGEEPMRCRSPTAAIPVSTMDPCARNKARPRPGPAAPRGRGGQDRGAGGEGDPSGMEAMTTKMLQPAGNGHHARRLKRTASSPQPPPFESPAHLQRYLNERRKRSADVQPTAGLESVTRAPGACQKLDFLVLPFYDLGLAGVIHPPRLEIGQCSGECPPIVQPSSDVPTYSHLASLLHTLHPDHAWPVPRPSCRPSLYQDFSVLRIEEGRTVAERWHNARVIGCTCF